MLKIPGISALKRITVTPGSTFHGTSMASVSFLSRCVASTGKTCPIWFKKGFGWNVEAYIDTLKTLYEGWVWLERRGLHWCPQKDPHTLYEGGGGHPWVIQSRSFGSRPQHQSTGQGHKEVPQRGKNLLLDSRAVASEPSRFEPPRLFHLVQSHPKCLYH